jgi:hypothetical protein
MEKIVKIKDFDMAAVKFLIEQPLNYSTINYKYKLLTIIIRIRQ